jgi:hypothetical protein
MGPGRGLHRFGMIFYVLSRYPGFFEKGLSLSEKSSPIYISETVQRVKIPGEYLT